MARRRKDDIGEGGFIAILAIGFWYFTGYLSTELSLAVTGIILLGLPLMVFLTLRSKHRRIMSAIRDDVMLYQQTESEIRKRYRILALIIASLSIAVALIASYFVYQPGFFIKVPPTIVVLVSPLLIGYFLLRLIILRSVKRELVGDQDQERTRYSRKTTSQRSLQFDLSPVAELHADSPESFEHRVAKVFEVLFHVGGKPTRAEVVGGSGDKGIDVKLWDNTGMLVAIVQCKRFNPNSTLNPRYLRELDSARKRLGVRKAYLVTTARFGFATRREADELKIDLVDGDTFEKMAAKAFLKPAGQL
jgi:hypothetical protein